MVVLVLIISCHVSLYPNNGPEMIQIKMINTAKPKAIGVPVKREANCENRENHDPDFLRDAMLRLLTAAVTFYSNRVGGVDLLRVSSARTAPIPIATPIARNG